MKDDTWDGVVVQKTRGLLDGSNLYRLLKVRRGDGQVVTVRVNTAMWKSVEVGDLVGKDMGQDPVKR